MMHSVDRRTFIRAIAGSGAASPLAAAAQQLTTVARIGILRPGSPPDRFLDAFRHGLEDLGYTEGGNITIEYRWANGRPGQLGPLAADLVRREPHVIVAAGNEVVLAVKQATRDIPIVMPVSTDPMAPGIVASLARPGGNITGFASQTDELPGKWLELLREIVPRLSRMAALWDPEADAGQLKLLKVGAEALGVHVHVVPVRNVDDITSGLNEAARIQAQSLVVLGSPFLFAHRARVVELAAKHRLPTIYHQKEFVIGGGLMSYAADFLDLFRRAAGLVDKILKGAKPADLPVEQPTKFELALNLKTAKALGLTMPPSVVARADEVIQ